MSQEKVALTAGVAVSTYARLERALRDGQWVNPQLDTMLKLICTLNLELSDLSGHILQGP